MADFSLTAGSFPAGATVGAYTVASQGSPSSAPSGAPSGAAAATATANADGSVDFTGLDAGVSYWAVDENNTYIRFRAPGNEMGGSGGSSFAHLSEGASAVVADWPIELTTAGDGIKLHSADGTAYIVTVTNDGTLDVTAA